jgi:hypothetical protein
MIEKPTILVSSIGRTGTQFFARLFARILPHATSLHEPDIFQNTGVDNRLAHYLQQVRLAGPWRMVVLKALGAWTLVKISDSKFLGRLNDGQAIRELNRQRKDFVARLPGSLYVEANIGYYGLLDIAPRIFREHRAVYIVRDGREWVRSHMNWGELYGKAGLRKLISHNWPAASDVRYDPYAGEWSRFTRFQQLCWAWARLNEYALNTLSGNPNARVYYFEEIFSGENKYQVLDDLVTFATSLRYSDSAPCGSTEGWLERKIHQSSDGFPAWAAWTNDQKNQFERICGPMMQKLGYPI